MKYDYDFVIMDLPRSSLQRRSRGGRGGIYGHYGGVLGSITRCSIFSGRVSLKNLYHKCKS